MKRITRCQCWRRQAATNFTNCDSAYGIFCNFSFENNHIYSDRSIDSMRMEDGGRQKNMKRGRIALLFHRFNFQFDYMTCNSNESIWRCAQYLFSPPPLHFHQLLALEKFSWTCLFNDNRFHKAIKIHVNMLYFSSSWCFCSFQVSLACST